MNSANSKVNVGMRVSVNSLVVTSDGTVTAEGPTAESVMVQWDGQTRSVRVLVRNIRPAK
jgi:hypothetical protein